MRKLSLLISLILIFIIGSQLNAQTILQGRVYDFHDHSVLAGANISINNLGCISDKDGRFEIVLSKGNYTLEVSFIGYKKFKKQFTISEGINSIEIQLKKSIFTVETIEVSAKGFQSDEMLSSARVQKISQEQIKSLPAQKLEGVLQYSSGVDVDNTMGMFSDKAVVSMRGMGGDNQGRMLVMIDGVPINKSDGGSVNWNAININNLSEIRIVQGAASTLYGANAMGGVIDLRTSIPKEKTRAGANIKYGTYNTLLADAHLGKSNVDSLDRGTFWDLALHGGTSDGYITESEEFLEYGEDTLLRPSYFDEISGEAKIGHSFSGSEQLVFSIKGYADKRGKGWQVFDDDGTYSSRRDLNTRLRYNGKISKSLYWETAAFGQFENYIKQNEYINSDNDFSMYEVDSKRLDAGSIIKFHFQKGIHLFQAGVDFRYGSVLASDNYFTSTDSIVNEGNIAIGALYLQDEMNFLDDRLLLTLGLRYDYAEFFDGNYSVYYPSKKINYLLHFQDTLMPNSHWQAISPRISLLYTNKENMRYYASFSSGFRPPTLDDMCRSQSSGNYFRRANPYLKNENINNMEIGGDIVLSKNIRLSASIYYSLGKDFMYQVSTGDSVDIGYKIIPVYQMDNISQMQAYGGETSLNIDLWKGARFFANYAYSHSTITNYEINDPEVDYDLTGKFLANVPMHSASGGISWENPIVNFNLLWKYKGERYINDRNTTDIRYFNSATYPSYQTLNLRLWKPLAYGCRIAFNIENITNTIYLDSQGRRCPGRMFFVELSWAL